MRYPSAICCLVLTLGSFGAAMAQERNNEAAIADNVKLPARGDGIPLGQIVSAVAKKIGKKFIVDNRVGGNVQIFNQDVAAVNYGDLLAILLLNGYTAIEGSSYISVIPISSVRDEPLPLASPKDNFPDAQFVTMVVQVRNVSAPQLVPILRPLMPTYGHLAAMPCLNSLLIVDNFANVKRVEKLIAILDAGKQPFTPPSCEAEGARAQMNSSK